MIEFYFAGTKCRPTDGVRAARRSVHLIAARLLRP